MRGGQPAAGRRGNRPLAYPHRLMMVRTEEAVSADRSDRPHQPQVQALPRASNSAMTVDVTWLRCLDKRDHVICEGAEVLGAGCLKAMCDTRIYPLGVSGPRRRCCRACREAVRVASELASRRVPSPEDKVTP